MQLLFFYFVGCSHYKNTYVMVAKVWLLETSDIKIRRFKKEKHVQVCKLPLFGAYLNSNKHNFSPFFYCWHINRIIDNGDTCYGS